ncbi:MAG: threonine synthase [Acidimicrobiales bacterium]
MTLGYESTRGRADNVDFPGALLAGLASDGGLFCPSDVPALPEIPAGAGYVEVAQLVMWPFVEGTIDRDDFFAMVAESYACFRDPLVCPVHDLGDGHHLLDLTQGPTLAFKDVALQLVGRLLDNELGRQQRRMTVLAATSGDTGSAAIEALRGRANVDIMVLHPEGRVSEVQRRQMTTVDADNVRNVAVVEASFDDCQNLVKAAFNDPELRAAFGLAAVNSINWARVMAQIVYYVWAARLVIGESGDPVSFTVPTGNFGNILAGWYAKRMGLNIDQLVVASNRNDVLTRFFETGALASRRVEPSLSPSMDIQISSNFERLLWEASGRDGRQVDDVLGRFASEGLSAVPDEWVAAIRSEFDAGRLDDDGTLAEIAHIHDRLAMLIDPHTAVGTNVARRLRRNPDVPMITLSTAAPAKFPDAVEQATGVRPPLPPFLSELFERPEFCQRADNSLADVAALLREFTGR